MSKDKAKTPKEGNVKISMQIGRTVNIGNYSNIKVDVGMELPVESNGESIEEGYDYLSTVLHDNLDQELELLYQEAKKGD